MAGSKANTQYLQEIFEEHLPYEIDMLRWGYQAVSCGVLDGHLRNAAIECFWLHARNLIEFFRKGHHNSYCVQTFRPFDANSSHIDALIPRINNQVSHLIFDRRTSDAALKLGGAEMTSCLQLLEAELVKLVSHLDQRWQPSWQPLLVVSSQQPPATNAPTTS